jgi:arylsulfatase
LAASAVATDDTALSFESRLSGEPEFDAAEAQSRRTLQYFEMFGNRGIYHDGWTAVTKHRTPWVTGRVKTVAFKDDVWELFDTRKAFSQAETLAAKYPDKLAELRVGLPLDDRTFERAYAAIAGRPDLLIGRTSTKLYPGMRLMATCAPNIYNTSFDVIADIDVLRASAGTPAAAAPDQTLVGPEAGAVGHPASEANRTGCGDSGALRAR